MVTLATVERIFPDIRTGVALQLAVTGQMAFRARNARSPVAFFRIGALA